MLSVTPDAVLYSDDFGSDAYQAEDARFSGYTIVESNHTGYSGTGFVNLPLSNGGIAFDNVDGGSGGKKTLGVRYALHGSTARNAALKVNGVDVNGGVSFAPTGSWLNWSVIEIEVPLNAGAVNTIEILTSGEDAGNIDSMFVLPSPGDAPSPGVTPSWSTTGGSGIHHAFSPSGAMFLGEFGNETVTLSLSDLPVHDQLTVSFDLNLLRSWDGNDIYSQDRWSLEADGATLLDTTFSNHPMGVGFADRSRQAYAGHTLPAGDYDAGSHAIRNSLGYTFPFSLTGVTPADSVYRLTYTFEHTSDSLTLDFSASGLSGHEDESWGIDNVLISTATSSASGYVWQDINGDGVRNTDSLPGDPADVLFVVDTSASTYDNIFHGETYIGDVNGDGRPQTVLDGEIAGFIALYESLVDRVQSGELTDTNVGLVLFDSDASSSGQTWSVAQSLLESSDIETHAPVVALKQIRAGGATNYSAGLRHAVDWVDSMTTHPGESSVIFISDGFANTPSESPSEYLDDVTALRSPRYAAYLRAFGAGTGASMFHLKHIDPAAQIFTDVDELLPALGAISDGSTTIFSEPGLEGWRVFADLHADGVWQTDEPYAITGPEGDYVLVGLPEGQ